LPGHLALRDASLAASVAPDQSRYIFAPSGGGPVSTPVSVSTSV
jgi:hypothetical protein